LTVLLQGTLKGKWRYLIPAITSIHNHMLIPNYQDFKIQDFCYSNGFECFQAINIGSSMDHVGQAAVAAPSSTILATDKGKAPMVDDSLPVYLLSEQECILKNLHDYQLGKELEKKLHAKQEAEFARQ
nr:hypothetical protein [Tanacetum cinerariifolium]